MTSRIGSDRPRLLVWEGLSVTDRPDPYLSIQAAASYCSLSPRFLRARMADPQAPLPHYRVGGRVLIRRSDLDAWLSQYRRARTDQAARIGAIVDEVVNAVTTGRKA